MAKRVISLAAARAQYVHRYTLEHIPAWARRMNEGNGRFYAPGYRTDAEWYAATVFPGEGNVHRKACHCESGAQSWPLGQWLSQAIPASAYLAATDDARLAAMRATYEVTA